MIPAAEIAQLIDIAVTAIRRRSRRAQVFERGDLVNEGWVVALETLPRQQRCGAPMGPYLVRAIIWSLGHATARWSAGWTTSDGPGALPDVPDAGPGPEAIAVARGQAAHALAALSSADREIVGLLLGAGGRRAAPAPEVARAAGVPIGRVYQARQVLARRAREAA